MISVRTKICTETCKKAVKSSVSDFAAYVSEILGHFHLCLTDLQSSWQNSSEYRDRYRQAYMHGNTNGCRNILFPWAAENLVVVQGVK